MPVTPEMIYRGVATYQARIKPLQIGPDVGEYSAIQIILEGALAGRPTMLNIAALTIEQVLAIACRKPRTDGKRGYYNQRVRDTLRRIAEEQATPQ